MRDLVLLAVMLLATLATGGCSTDLSSYPPFSEQIGRTQMLKNAAWLQGERPPYVLSESEPVGDAVRLEAGTEVVIDEVVRESMFGLAYMYKAVGHTTGANAKPFRFYWGQNGLIYSAPWEKFESGEGVRWVGPKGTRYGEPMPVYTYTFESPPSHE